VYTSKASVDSLTRDVMADDPNWNPKYVLYPLDNNCGTYFVEVSYIILINGKSIP